MQTPRRLLAVLAALSVALTLVTGCTITKKSQGGNLPDGATLVKESAESAKGVKSAHIVLTVNGKIPGLSIKMLSGDLNTEPTAAKGNVKIAFGGSDVDADFVVFDGILYAALSPNSWTQFGKAADVYDPSQILSPDKGVANVLATFSEAKAEGREDINGQPTIRIKGKATAEAVNAIAPPFAASEPVPATLWIQETGAHQLAQAKLERGAGNSVQMTLSNWGQQVQITKPAE